MEEVDVGPDTVEYAVYGQPGELPALPDLEAVAGGALIEVSTSDCPSSRQSFTWSGVRTRSEPPSGAKTASDQDSFAERGNGFGYTFPVGHPFLRLDRILGKGVRFARTGVGGKEASDHRPVYADVALLP